MAHLPGRDELPHRTGDVLDRHLRVHPVLVEQVDRLDAQPLQRGVGDLDDVLRAAVQAGLAALGVEPEPELGGDHHLLPERRQCLADRFLVHERAVDLGGVEEGDPPLDGRADHRDAVLAVGGRAEPGTDAHAAEPDAAPPAPEG
jgi:hypothetical protein